MITSLSELVAEASGLHAGRVAVAAAHDSDVIGAVCKAARCGIANPILIGDAKKIECLLAKEGEKADTFEIIDAHGDEACANLAVECAATGKANLLMKGLLNTSDLMRAVLKNGLHAGNLISHIMFYELNGSRIVALTDGGMNPFPTLAQKADILENAAKILCALGYNRIYAACICGAEKVNPKFGSMVEAQQLCEMQERWTPYRMKVYGPVGLDLAISEEACRHKGYEVEGGGQADILLAPNYEVGNAMGKAMSIVGGVSNAGFVVGAKVPIVLVSRADRIRTKLNSIALGAIAARNMETGFAGCASECV